MIFRSITLVTALAGGLSAAQFPAFSQQYVQRLGGAVSALEQVVVDFDTSAAKVGLTRDEALEQMQGTAFVEARRRDMVRTLTRYHALHRSLAIPEGAGPFMRAYHMRQLGDTELMRGTWAAYEPAVPLRFASLLFAGAGMVATLLGLGLIGRLLRRRPSRQSALCLTLP